MNLFEEVNQIAGEAHEKWFNRWYERTKVENQIKVSASEGYGGLKIEVSDERNDYLKLRLENEKTVNLLKERLGEGFKVEFVTDTWKGLLGYECHKSYIKINW